MLTKIDIKTEKGESLVNITPQVRSAVKNSGIKDGICVMYIPHTTAAITINSGMDSRTSADVVEDVHRLIPTRTDFHHIFDTPADAAGHIKAVLIGNSQTVIVANGDMMLGSSQSIFFFEFDGPRHRQVVLRIMRDQD